MVPSIEINGTALQVLQHADQRVVTFSQIDEVHSRPEGTAGRNFREHRARFVEGEDFYRMGADEFRRRLAPGHSKFASEDVVLLAESGYLMLVKAFTDDLAWDVQRKLIRSYFAAPKPEMSRLEVLKIALDAEQARIAAEVERDLAIATKAQIGSRREATAMAKASAAVKQVNRLQEQLGASRRHATVLAVENAMHTAYGWRHLKKWCDANGQQPEDVPDPRYGWVKAWPAAAWLAVFSVNLCELFPACEMTA